MQLGEIPVPTEARHDNDVGTGHELFLGNELGLNFDLPTPVQEVSFEYGAFCCDTGLVINGVPSALADGFSGLDGTSLVGVSIIVNVAPPVFGNEVGSVLLQGHITSLVVGGVEVFIDNVSTTVPEPSTASLLLIGWFIAASAGLFRHRRAAGA